MRFVKLVSAAALAVLALTAIASATASAALPEILPGSGSFTSTSGAGTLQQKGGASIICKTDTNSGAITGVKTGTLTVDFFGCTVLGFAANSKGDASGVILVSLDAEAGYINKSTQDVGLALQILPTTGVEIEVPAAAEKLVVKGTVIGLLSPVNSNKTGPFVLTLKQTAGVQEFTKFEGGSTQILLTSVNGGTFAQSGEQTTDSITFAAAHEIMA